MTANETSLSLLASSQRFSQSATAAYAAEQWDVFYLHLATAVEQLVKAALADAHPSFIADPNATFDSLLHLAGFGKRAKTPETVGVVRTITITQALERVPRLIDNYRQPGPLVRVLLDTRNAIVHIGHDPKAKGDAILAGVARFVTPLLAALQLEPDLYWGESWPMVHEHDQRRLSELEALFIRRVQAAKDNYRHRTEGMDDAARAAFIAAVETTSASESFELVPAECPACGNQGALVGDATPEWEPDWDYGDGQAYVAGTYISSIELTGHAFDCRACNLSLDADLLPSAGLDSKTLTEKEWDVSSATSYYERLDHEDALADAYDWREG